MMVSQLECKNRMRILGWLIGTILALVAINPILVGWALWDTSQAATQSNIVREDLNIFRAGSMERDAARLAALLALQEQINRRFDNITAQLNRIENKKP